MRLILDKIIKNMSQVIIGKEALMRQLLIAYLCEGHVLIEGNPGLGKTKLALSLIKSIEGKFNRIQFTPDILPSDITGYYLLNRQTEEMMYKEGIVFCNFLLADEINRASPRVQSSLLEAMEEGQVTVEGKRRRLLEPFMVIATENALEQEGTYPLPEAQLDRFFMKLCLEYPSTKEWESILDLSEQPDPLNQLEQVIKIEEVKKLKEAFHQIVVSPSIKKYIVQLAAAINHSEGIQMGVSPRGTIALLKASKGEALFKGRSYVLPDDVQAMLYPIVGHRIILKDDEIWENNKIKKLLEDIIYTVEVPY